MVWSMVSRFKSLALYRPADQYITRPFLIGAARSLTAMPRLCRFILIKLLCSKSLPAVARAAVVIAAAARGDGHRVVETLPIRTSIKGLRWLSPLRQC